MHKLQFSGCTIPLETVSALGNSISVQCSLTNTVLIQQKGGSTMSNHVLVNGMKCNV